VNGLDLFSGIGGISLALEPWVRTVAYCENDRYAQAVLLSRMRDGRLPVAPIWDDVRTLKGNMLPEIDIIFGGFPCQDISVAGHGIGLGGSRSGLFWEIHRLVKELRPRFIFLENVPAIRTRGALEVARSLESIGYDQNWDIISALEVGAPFPGERWFLVAAANGEALRIKQRRRNGQSRKTSALNSSACDLGFAPWSHERGFESKLFGVGNGVPFPMDRDRCLGNAVVPLQARKAFEKLIGVKT